MLVKYKLQVIIGRIKDNIFTHALQILFAGSLIVLAASERMQVFESTENWKISTYAALERVIRLFGNFTCILVKGTANISIPGQIGTDGWKIVRFFIGHHAFGKLHVICRYLQLIAVFQ